ncbi:hypothetical protein [Lentzea sp. HUAS12]|uniref:hypothetical protein n=1 Tax=Lentzea sp. HUAS12 TaxID=2951806 RepID=UPI00209D77EF|nr:hypothetical protein [Lentzea sp. HUAS12]USX56463.1 hypothetical protein ND450_20890 [Lentzea sp. HUAS12]
MKSRFAEPDYQLLWPRALFVSEAASLLNKRELIDWDDRCELLLEDAFIGDFSGGPLSEFREIPGQPDPFGMRPRGPVPRLSPRQNFLLLLMRAADELAEDDLRRRPYWSQRKNGTEPELASLEVTAGRFVELITDLDEKGYFEKRFEKDCIDYPRDDLPARTIERAIGVSGVWPLDPDWLGKNLDLFCDVVEVLHDLVARPTTRSIHPFNECGWHHGDFVIETGRAVYRWRVNMLLRQSDLGLRLAEEGEDIGRMVVTTSDSRAELVEALVATEGDTGDQVRHAVALFRRRGADRNEKRSAIVSLGRVLENKRKLLRAELLSKDEDALFLIANRFDIRHQNEVQKSDYDEIFLDWIYWWYLATIELADKLAARGSSTDSASKSEEPATGAV